MISAVVLYTGYVENQRIGIVPIIARYDMFDDAVSAKRSLARDFYLSYRSGHFVDEAAETLCCAGSRGKYCSECGRIIIRTPGTFNFRRLQEFLEEFYMQTADDLCGFELDGWDYCDTNGFYAAVKSDSVTDVTVSRQAHDNLLSFLTAEDILPQDIASWESWKDSEDD